MFYFWNGTFLGCCINRFRHKVKKNYGNFTNFAVNFKADCSQNKLVTFLPHRSAKFLFNVVVVRVTSCVWQGKNSLWEIFFFLFAFVRATPHYFDGGQEWMSSLSPWNSTRWNSSLNIFLFCSVVKSFFILNIFSPFLVHVTYI